MKHAHTTLWLLLGGLQLACGSAPDPDSDDATLPSDGATGPSVTEPSSGAGGGSAVGSARTGGGTGSSSSAGAGGGSGGSAGRDCTIYGLDVASTDEPSDPTNTEPVETERRSDVAHETGGDRVICSEVDYTLEQNVADFVPVAALDDELWPGALIEARSASANRLETIPVDRNPVTVYMDLVTGDGDLTEAVDSPTHSTVLDAQRKIIQSYGGATPAQFTIGWEQVHSTEHLAVAAGAHVAGTSFAAALDVSFDQFSSESHLLLEFVQTQFTMSVDDLTEETIACGEDLSPYVEAGDPVLYVSSVAYGRRFYLLFSSSESAQSLEAAISAAYNSATLQAGGYASVEHQRIVNEASVRAYAMGGNAGRAVEAATGYSFEDGHAVASLYDHVREFLIADANFGADSPPVPISYELKRLDNNRTFKVGVTSEYTVSDCRVAEICDDGSEPDACGVCGGDGRSCLSCDRDFIPFSFDDPRIRITFELPQGDPDDVYAFDNGSHHELKTTCRRVQWADARFTCENGEWVASSLMHLSADKFCHGDTPDQEGITFTTL